MGREVRRDEAFGQRLTEAMERRDVRPGELAKAQNVSPGTVSRWRAGECPDDLRFPSLAAYLRVPEEWLKTGAGNVDWSQGEKVPARTSGRSPGRRADDKARAMQADAARLSVLLDRIRMYRDQGRSPSPEILEEWLAIMRANSLGGGPPGSE